MTKIRDVKTTIYKWTGEIVPPAQNFCTNPTDTLRAVSYTHLRAHET